MKKDGAEKIIFVTVGTQLPFNRVFEFVDFWVNNTKTKAKILAQKGGTEVTLGCHEAREFLGGEDFTSWLQKADCIVAHAGMGTIIEASINKKNLIIVPRKSAFGEHRNDHQLDTANKFRNMSNIRIAETKEEFFIHIEELLSSSDEIDADKAGLGGELGFSLDQWISENTKKSLRPPRGY